MTRVAFRDGLPISEHLKRADTRFATAWWHWFFFASRKFPNASSAPIPTRGAVGIPQKMGVENHDEWRAVTRNPDVVRAMLEDCRAGLTIDREHEEADYAGARGSTAPFWSCCRCKTTWRTCTAIR